MDIRFVLGLSVLLQFVAAVLAFRLMRVTGRRWAWGAIALAVSLMAVRRTITWTRLMSADPAVQPDLSAELVALVISILMVWGVGSIAPFFSTLRRSAKAIAESEERYRTLAEHAPVGIFRTDANGDCLYVNERLCEWTGRGPASFLGMGWLDAVCAEDRDRVRRNWQRAIAKGEQFTSELRFEGRDGQAVWVVALAKPKFADDGTVSNYVGTVTDITARRRAEEELRKSKASLVEAQRVAHMGSWDWDMETGALTWSDGVYRVFGLEPREFDVTYDAFLAAVHPDDRAFVQAHVDAAVEGREAYEIDHRIVLPNGDIRHVHEQAEVARDDDGRVRHMLGTVIDVTDQKRVEETLRIRERQQAVVVELGQLALAGVELDAWMKAAVTRVAETLQVEFCKVLECLPDSDELLLRAGVGWREGLVGQVSVCAGADSQAGYTLSSDRPVVVADLRTETRFRGPALLNDHGVVSGLSVLVQGGERPFGVLGAHTTKLRTFSADDVNFLQAVANLLSDLWQRKRAEEERERLAAQLRQAQKMEAVGQLAGGVAHDFNNLLTVISANASLLRNDRNSPEEVRMSIDMIERAVEQASNVTQSLLAFGRKLPADKTHVDLCATVRSMLAMLERTMPASIELTVDTACDPQPWVHGDATQLQQVVLNLVVNARDAMPKGGHMSLAVTTVKEPGPDGEKAFARLVVRDDGVGMPPEVSARIFDPFYTTKARGQGTGLGLAVVDGIVRDHGGRIDVRSTVGSGTTFTIDLPCVEAGVAEAPDATFHARRGDGELILLAEAQEQVRSVLSLTLNSLGYEVVEAGDGEALLERFREYRERIRMLVIDVDLPKRNGLDCLRLIRNEGVLTHALVVTGSAGVQLDDQDTETTLLRKPFPMSRLGEAVYEALHRSASASIA